jgi:hypothetical protein
MKTYALIGAAGYIAQLHRASWPLHVVATTPSVSPFSRLETGIGIVHSRLGCWGLRNDLGAAATAAR